MIKPNQEFVLKKYGIRGWETTSARVIRETSVTLTVNGEPWLGLMCTPLDLEALAVGFIVNEGLIQTRQEIASVRVCPSGDNVDVWLNHAVERPTHWRRTSGCSGGMTATSQERPGEQPHLKKLLSPRALLQLMGQLYQSQDLYRETGGVHTSAICDDQGIVIRAEDVGRHNTFDKLAGRMLLDQIQVAPLIVLTTGRISSEMLQKAARMGAVAVVSRTSPTNLSVQLADQWNITLVGYARREQFTVYAHPENFEMDPEPVGLALGSVSAFSGAGLSYDD